MKGKFKKKDFDGLILANFITQLLYMIVYPHINKAIVTAVSSQLLSLNNMIQCFGVMAVSYLWDKKTDKMYKYFDKICMIETITNLSTLALYIFTRNLSYFYIMDTIMYASATQNILSGIIKLKAIRYNSEDARVHFDNIKSMTGSFATILGSIISMFINVNNVVGLLIWASIANSIDNFFYIIIYRKTKNRSLNKAESEEND